jgi:hypothetical protein
VDVRPVGDKLQLRPPGRLPSELLAAIKEHKHAIITFLSKPDTVFHDALSRALEQKHQEIAFMRARLYCPSNADDAEYHSWCRDQIQCLAGHITEIQRYLKEGGALSLPPCCKEQDHICLIAMRRFDGCLMLPGECTFSMRKGNVD